MTRPRVTCRATGIDPDLVCDLEWGHFGWHSMGQGSWPQLWKYDAQPALFGLEAS